MKVKVGSEFTVTSYRCLIAFVTVGSSCAAATMLENRCMDSVQEVEDEDSVAIFVSPSAPLVVFWYANIYAGAFRVITPAVRLIAHSMISDSLPR
jgi:hypothetical protein